MPTNLTSSLMRDILCSGSAVLSVLLSLVVSTAGSFVNGWVFMVLATLAVTPCFLHYSKGSVFSALFCYLVTMSISSGLILMGIINPVFFTLLILGFVTKFGVFPFMAWVYWVYSFIGWIPIYVLAVAAKMIAVFFAFFSCGKIYSDTYVEVWCVITLITLIPSFWVWNSTWVLIWCHMVLSSSSVLLLICVCSPGESILLFFSVYAIVNTGCVVVLFWSGGARITFVCRVFYLCVFFISTPISWVIVYKIISIMVITEVGAIFVVLWCICIISEQLFILTYVTSPSKPKKIGRLSWW